MGRKLYCGNLSFRVDSSSLEELFSQYGQVQSAQVITDRDTGRSKGFGFVEMSTDAEAQAAIDGLHETEFNGRNLTVNEARPKDDRRGGGGGGYGGGGGGGGGGQNGSSSTITSTSTSNFWPELERNIAQIIDTTNRQVALTDQSSAPVSTPTAVPVIPASQLAAVGTPAGGAAPMPTPAMGTGTTDGTTQPNAPAQDPAAQQQAAAAQMAAAAASMVASANAGGGNMPTAGLLNPTGSQNAVATEGDAGSVQTAFFSVNRQAGMVNVFATEKQHELIGKYIREMLRALNTQILIEAKVLEIELRDENSLGIDWAVVGRRVSGGLSLPQENFAFEPFAANSGGILNITTGDFSAVINAISRFGNVRSLASPRLTVMNNQTAVLNVSESRVFFEIEINRTDGTANNPPRVDITSTVNNVPEGVIITVHPSVDPDTHEITMNLRPSITRVVRTVSDPGVRIAAQNANINVESFVPELSIREIDSIVKMNSGGTVVMGGLMQDRVDNRQVGIPVLSEIPVLGAAFRSQRDTLRKTEMVIMLRARVVDQAAPDDTDRELYETMARDRRPLDF